MKLTKSTLKPGEYVTYIGKNDIPISLMPRQPGSEVKLLVKSGAPGRITEEEPQKIGDRVAYPVEFSITIIGCIVLSGCLFIQEDQIEWQDDTPVE